MICPGRRAPLDVLTQQLEPFQAQRPHAKPTKQASGLGLGFRVGVVAAVSRSRKQYHRRAKKALRRFLWIFFLNGVFLRLLFVTSFFNSCRQV